MTGYQPLNTISISQTKRTLIYEGLNYLVYFLALGFLEMDRERGTFSFVSI